MARPKYVIAMLRRFEEADEWGIDRQHVPADILFELQSLGYVTKLDIRPMITDAGRTLLRAAGTVDDAR